MAIKKLKYKNISGLAPILSDLLIAATNESSFVFGEKSLIIPIPLHPLKKYERGFNQSSLIAEQFSKKLGLIYIEEGLCKVKETISQTKLKIAERSLNVKNSFIVNPRYSSELKNKDIILIDDVFTTGATLREGAKVLKKAGARYVYLLAVAKD